MGIPKEKSNGIFTYKDYCSWPDDERWELIEGTAYDMSPAPVRKHQKISSILHTIINNYLSGKPCESYAAPFDVLFPASKDQLTDEITTVVQPDISVICDKSILTDAGCTGAPDMLIEILSPSTAKKDMDEKYHLYEKHGVKEYWVVDPGSEYIRIFIPDENKKYGPGKLYSLTDKSAPETTAESLLLKGFSIDFKELFRDE